MLHSSFSSDGCWLRYDGAYYVAFLACGFENGFSVFQCHPFKKLYSRSSLTCGYFIIAFQKGGIGLIELLDHSNIVAMVGGGKKPLFSPNTVPFLVYSHFKVMLWDDAKARFVGEVNVNMKVLSICIDTKRFVCFLSLIFSLVVATIQKIYVFDLSTLTKQQEYSTYENEYGLVAINKKVMVIPDKGRGALRILVYSSSSIYLL